MRAHAAQDTHLIEELRAKWQQFQQAKAGDGADAAVADPQAASLSLAQFYDLFMGRYFSSDNVRPGSSASRFVQSGPAEVHASIFELWSS